MPPSGRRVTVAEFAAMAADYLDGMSVREVALRHGVAQSSAYRYLVAAGVEFRPRGAWRVGWKKNPVVLGRRNCGRCGRWRYLHEFGRAARERGMSTECLACTRARSREARADPVRGPLRREYERIWAEGHGRSRGSGVVSAQPVRRAGTRLPAPPLAAAVRRVIAQRPSENGWRDVVCETAGIDTRQIRAWRSGEIPSVEFATVDRVLTRLGLCWWDVYCAPADYAQAVAVFEPEMVAA